MPLFGPGKLEKATQELQNSVADTRRTVEETSKRLESIIHPSSTILENVQKETNTANTDLRALTSQIQEGTRHLDRASTEIADRTKQLVKREKAIFDIQDRIESIQAKDKELSRRETALDERIQKLEEMEKQLSDVGLKEKRLNARLNNLVLLEEQLRNREITFNSLMNRTSKMLSDLQTLREECSLKEKTIALQLDDILKKNKALDLRKSDLDAREVTIKNLERERETCLKDIAKLHSYTEDKRRSLENRMIEEEKMVTDLRKDFVDRQDFLSSYARRLAERYESCLEIIEKNVDTMPTKDLYKLHLSLKEELGKEYRRLKEQVPIT